jgi:hypothetical protein
MTEENTPTYSRNTRAFTFKEAGLVVALTVVLIVAKLLGWLAISWTLTAIPLLFVGAMMYLYSFLRNAIHEAIRLADADAYLDDQNIARINEMSKRTLTPTRLADAMKVVAE